MVTRRRLLVQFSQFLTVGGLATLTHITVFVALIESLDVRPLLANLYAFCVAFTVGFSGHFYWTFAHEKSADSRQPGLAVWRFLLVSLLGLALNSLVVYTVVGLLSWSYVYAVVVMVTLVPLLLFLLNKTWAFA